MLSSMEMVSEPSGKTKTLADLIKEGGILTPETPVYTSDDSIELEDYIESLIPAPTPSFSETVLFLNEDVSGGNPAEIDLSDDYINYDALYIDVVRSADTTLYQMPHLILVSVLGNDGKFQFIEQFNRTCRAARPLAAGTPIYWCASNNGINASKILWLPGGQGSARPTGSI